MELNALKACLSPLLLKPKVTLPNFSIALLSFGPMLEQLGTSRWAEVGQSSALMSMTKWVWPTAHCDQHSHFLTSPGFGSANRVHQYWFYGSPRVSASKPALALFLLWQSPGSLLRAHLGTLAGRSYQVSSKEESFTDGAFFAADPLSFTDSVQFGWHRCVRKMPACSQPSYLAAHSAGRMQYYHSEVS